MLVIVPIVGALLVGAVVLARVSDQPDGDATVAVTDLEATDVVVVGSLADLADAAECVLGGEVVHTERGRAIGSDLVSRLVQIRVDEALAGDCPSGTVVSEEEGWLADGTPVSVDGWPGSEVGDMGVWFLVAGTSDELPYASTVATTGAPRWRGGQTIVPDTAPGWLLEAIADGPGGLAERVRSLP
jgi:hypothetical protein